MRVTLHIPAKGVGIPSVCDAPVVTERKKEPQSRSGSKGPNHQGKWEFPAVVLEVPYRSGTIPLVGIRHLCLA